jgi:SAM-dependent methyltransferase
MEKELKQFSQQSWTDEKFCKQYAETWEISTDEVHYGWLAPGEATLKLFHEIDLPKSNVLDIGCGMGENLIAIEKKGARCFGIDISAHMLKYAKQRNSKLYIAQEDMRALSSFPQTRFDLILSIYSLEYLDSVKEFRDVLAALYYRLHPGGLFVFCFSHPIQHIRHSMLRNETAVSDLAVRKAPLIYSFKDVINCLHDVGFTVERIVEQQTLNPSQISYEDSKKFPYHFHRKKNPCRAEFDANSNGGPHTIIYKVKKPDRGAIFNRQMSLEIGFGKIRVWGEERIIRDVREFKSADNKYTIYELAPIDSVVGFCNVLSFKVESRDLGKKQKISLNVGPQRPEWRDIMAGSLLGMIAKRLRGTKLKCYFQEDWIPIDETKKFLRAIFISRIDPIFEKIINHFPNQEIGLLIFVNGEEPASGKVGAQEFFPTIGDKIDVVYVILKRGCIWTYRGPHLGDQFELSGSQLSFFTWENS